MDTTMDILRILLPLLSICVIVVYLIFIAKKKQNEDDEGGKNKKQNYMSEGMVIGMCLGISLANIFDKKNIGTGSAIGMMIGMIVGMNIRK